MLSPEGRYWFLGSGLFAATCFSALAAEMRFARIVTAPPRPAPVLRHHGVMGNPGLELPPGASFDPDPQNDQNPR